MTEVSETIVRWLEQKRRADRTWAAGISLLALGSGAAVFLLVAFVIYSFLIVLSSPFAETVRWQGLGALGLTAWFFAHTMKRWRHGQDLNLDPLGLWILKDISSVGPRLVLEGLRQMRCWELLGELNVGACAGALAYLAKQNTAVSCEELRRHCPQLAWERLKEQLLLLDTVLFLGKDAGRVILMEPFRLRLRWMLGRDQGPEPEPARPRPQAEPSPHGLPVHEPEKLSAYEILGLSPSATPGEIKRAYRKRVKECHPDLFAGMDQQAKALAERWTRALNAAYATLNPRPRDARPSPTRQP